MGAAVGTQAVPEGDAIGVAVVGRARAMLHSTPTMANDEVIFKLGALPDGLKVDSRAISKVREFADSSASDAEVWAEVSVVVGQARQDAEAATEGESVAADYQPKKPVRARRNSRNEEFLKSQAVLALKSEDGATSAGSEVAAAHEAASQSAADSECFETSYMLSPEFRRAHCKKNVPYPPIPDHKVRPFPRDKVGAYSIHGQADVNKYKENQDRGLVCYPFAVRKSDERRALFVVCDGHGEFGHSVSDYVIKHLLKNMQLLLEAAAGADLSFAQIKQTFVEVSNALTLEPDLDSATSGTTCVCAIVKPNSVVTANCGDSRCVVGQRIGTAPPSSKVPCLYRAHDLSVDHKPDAADERERIEKCGGFVNKPEWSASARVWLDSTCTWPGLAMARSIGDQCVKHVGVTAEPDLREYVFQPNDAFVCLASDGVWEFLSSDDVVQIISMHLHNATKADMAKLAEVCAQEVIKFAVKQWKIHEDGYRDDISCTVIFLPLFDDAEVDAESPS